MAKKIVTMVEQFKILKEKRKERENPGARGPVDLAKLRKEIEQKNEKNRRPL